MSSPLSGLGNEIETALGILNKVRDRIRTMELAAAESVARDDWSQLARRFFEDWCYARRKPPLMGELESVDMEVAASPAGLLPTISPRVLLRDAKLSGPLVRVSVMGSAAGLVWPNPDTHREPAQEFLFRGLPDGWSENAAYVHSLEPRTVSRLEDGQWEVT